MQVAGSEWIFGETQPGQTSAASTLWLCCLPSSATQMYMPDFLHRHTTDQLQGLVEWLHQPHRGGHTGTTPHLMKPMKCHPGGDNSNRGSRIGLVAIAPGDIAGVLVCFVGLKPPISTPPGSGAWSGCGLDMGQKPIAPLFSTCVCPVRL